MIPISQIDPELSIYKENTVVIWGAGQYGREILKLLQNFNVVVAYFCDSDIKKWKTEIEGVPVILPQELMKMQLEHIAQKNYKDSKIVVQFGLHPVYVAEVKPLVEAMGIEKVICYDECTGMLSYYKKCKTYSKSPELLELQESRIENPWGERIVNIEQHILDNWDDIKIFITTCGKTGDITLKETLAKHGRFSLVSHCSYLFNKPLFIQNRMKIITAVRDPIGRDISAVYQYLCKMNYYPLTTNSYLAPSNDAQIFFEKCLFSGEKRHLLFQGDGNPPHLGAWFEKFKENFVDIREYPFDQEKGYTIIKEGNYDIFIYQLEKLNDLVPELSDWVGVPFTELVNGNEASTKWIANSYKQAQKELKFSQEYFDLCYNDPYVQHCYSPEDIEKFKDRWRKNIDLSK